MPNEKYLVPVFMMVEGKSPAAAEKDAREIVAAMTSVQEVTTFFFPRSPTGIVIQPFDESFIEKSEQT